MLGNDVVDLRDPEAWPGTIHPRFDERVFSSQERAALAASDSPEQERWRLWAAKEAAHKAARQSKQSICFAPRRFRVDGSEKKRTVELPCGMRFGVEIVEELSGIHAIAVPLGMECAQKEMTHAVERMSEIDLDKHSPQGPGRAVRRIVRERVADRLGVSAKDLEVRREARVPKLWLRGEPLAIDLSLSHHGGLVAFAFASSAATGPGRSGS